MAQLTAGFHEAMAELAHRGLLLVHDSVFPSLTRLTIGEPIRGSWWAHPLSNDVHMVSQRLQHSGDVVMLESGKETCLHRQLWPHLLAIGISREAWQLDGLPASAQRRLLTSIAKAASGWINIGGRTRVKILARMRKQSRFACWHLQMMCIRNRARMPEG